MQGSEKGEAKISSTALDGHNLSIGIVQARFNAEITGTLAEACITELRLLGVDEKHIRHVTVPGALEVAVALDQMARSDDFDALVALGCIIRGETFHFELVSNESGAAVTRVSLDNQIPIANAILTVENMDQAWARATVNGREAARVAVEMANLMEALQ